ncbi:MAG: hypothetical protein AAGE98_00170 [Actinomycetota bacterium]
MRPLLVIIAMFAASVATAGAQSSPSLEVNPTTVEAGSKVVADGAQFRPGEVELYLDSLDSPVLGTASVDRAGTFRISFAAPDDIGAHRLIACRDRGRTATCEQQAFASFTIVAPATTTTSTTTDPPRTTTSTTTTPPSTTTDPPRTTTSTTTTPPSTAPPSTTTTPRSTTTDAPPSTVVVTTTQAPGDLSAVTTTTTEAPETLTVVPTTTTTEPGTLAVPTTTVGPDQGVPVIPGDFVVPTTTVNTLTGELPIDDVDLALTHIEVTQGLQNLDNDFPLVADRPTGVRLFGVSHTGIETLGSAFLEVSRGGELLAVLEAENNPVAFRDELVRISNDFSPYFILDTDWIVDELTFRAVIIAGDPTLANDANPADNFIETTVTFDEATPVTVQMYPLYITDEGISGGDGEVVTHTAASGFLQQVVSTYRIWPVGQMSFNPFHPVIGDADSGWDFVTEDELVTPWTELAAVAADHTGSHELVMGMYSPLAPSQWGGFSQGLGGNSWSKMRGTWSNAYPWHGSGGAIIAQELGHDLGIEHAPCQFVPGETLPGELHGGPIDDTFPQAYGWPSCSIAPEDREGFYGFDVMYSVTGTDEPSIMSNRVAANAPYRATPFMGYASTGKWVDPWHGCMILAWVDVPCEGTDLIPIDGSTPGQGQGLPPVGTGGVPRFNCDELGFDTEIDLCTLAPVTPFDPAAYEPGDGQMLVTGTLSLDTGAAALEAGVVIDSGSPTIWLDNERDPAPYLLVLLDADGNALSAQNVDRAKWSGTGHAGDDHDGSLTPPGQLLDIRFAEMVPLVEGLDRIVLLHEDGVLATLDPGDAAPEVVITSAHLVGGAVEVTWTVEDPDGDPTSSIVRYEGLDGWETVAVPGASGGTVAVDASVLAGGRSASFRIVASDGVHTTTVDSEPIELPENPPFIGVAIPADGIERPQGRPVEFRAFVHDPEGTDVDVTWRSDLDGDVGTGERITLTDLRVGRHVMTAVAVDAAGNEATSSLRVTISEPDGVDSATMAAIVELFTGGPTPASEGGGAAVPLVAGGLVVLAVLAGGIGLRRRRSGVG